MMKDGAAVGSFGIERGIGSAGESGKNDMGAANSAQQTACPVRTVERWQMRSTQGPVQLMTHPASTRWSFPVMRSRSSTPRGPTLGNIHCDDFTVIADYGSGVFGFDHPLGNEALREFALRVFVVQNLPFVAGIEGAMDAGHIHFTDGTRFLA